MEKKLESMNIIVNRQLLPGDLQAGRHYTNPGGIRLGVSELTRLGMGKSEMEEVADMLHVALTIGQGRARSRSGSAACASSHQKVKYSFKTSPAYFYRSDGAAKSGSGLRSLKSDACSSLVGKSWSSSLTKRSSLPLMYSSTS